MRCDTAVCDNICPALVPQFASDGKVGDSRLSAQYRVAIEVVSPLQLSKPVVDCNEALPDVVAGDWAMPTTPADASAMESNRGLMMDFMVFPLGRT